LKAQLGIEFFLTASVVLAFMLITYGVYVSESEKNKVLESAVLSKTLLDSLSAAANFAALSGNASAIPIRVYAPMGANCFYYDAATKRAYCSLVSPAVGKVSQSDKVYGPVLVEQLGGACSMPLEQNKWFDLRVFANASGVFASC